MVIGINGYEAVVPRFGYDKEGLPSRVGSGEFSFRLISEFSKDTNNKYIIYLPKAPTSDMPQETENFRYSVFTTKKLWTMTGLSKRLYADKEKIDVFLSPTHYLPLFVPCPSVVSILDVSYLHFPKLFKKKDLYQLKIWGGYSIRKSSAVITISESSRSDIIRAYGLSPNKVTVAYPGLVEREKEDKPMDELDKKYGVKGKYILFVGTLQPRKNIKRLIEAFSKLKDKDVDLVVVGKKGWMYDEIINSPSEFGVGNRVKFLDSVEDENLPTFYKNAIFFILPSLYEGFGLPVLEAMEYGCPVITSNVSSLPEAGGDAVLYVNPEDVKDITEKMQKLLQDDSLRKELVAKGREQVKKFSWKKTAEQTIKVLEGLNK